MARNRTSRKIVINFRLSVTRKSNKRGGRTKQKHDNMDDDSVYWTIMYIQDVLLVAPTAL